MQFEFDSGHVFVDMIKFTNLFFLEFKDIVGFAKMLAYNDLFSVDDTSIPLTSSESKRCYRGVQMAAWLVGRNRFEIGPAVAFLKSRMSKLTQQDFTKFKRVIMYLRKYLDL